MSDIISRDDKTVTILNSRYVKLLLKEGKLNALVSAGVNNWDGYDEAMDMLEGEEEKTDQPG